MKDFQAEAEKYVEETDYISNENRRLAGNAFQAGAQVGYEDGKADGNENAIYWQQQCLKIKEECDALRAQLADAEEALKFYADGNGGDEYEDAEAIKVHEGQMTEHWITSFGKHARAYFTKHSGKVGG